MARLYLGLAVISPLLAVVTEALRLTSLDVPSTVRMGSSVWLNCTLDKENDDLYSVKWYKNDDEFYRYLPRDKPSLQKYDIPGIYIDVQKSMEGSVLLSRTDQNSEGVYRCEASAESPTFQTVTASKELSVYAIPTEGPIIKGNLPQYDQGDQINVTCQSGRSRPPAILKWLINNNDAQPHFLVKYPVVNDSDGLSVSKLGLKFKADSMFFEDGTLTINCTAIVSHVFAMSSEQLILGDNKHSQTEQLVESLPGPSFKTSDDSPLITGSRTKYRVGDYVNVNCSSPTSRPHPQLNWYINDVQASRNYITLYGQEPSEVPLLNLQFQVRGEHFDRGGELRLKCTATVSKIINTRSNEKILGSHQWTSGLHASESEEKVRNLGSQREASVLWSFTFLLYYRKL